MGVVIRFNSIIRYTRRDADAGLFVIQLLRNDFYFAFEKHADLFGDNNTTDERNRVYNNN